MLYNKPQSLSEHSESKINKRKGYNSFPKRKSHDLIHG